MTNKTITLQDISQKLNLTKTTVSKALRNHPDVAPETKKRILKLADKLGFVPNEHASKLSARKTKTIGLVLPYIADNYYSKITDNIYRIAQLHGFDIILAITNNNLEYKNIQIRKMLANRVEALIISITDCTFDSSIYSLIRKRNVPIILINNSMPLGKDFLGLYNDTNALYKIFSHAAKWGYRKITFFSGDKNIISDGNKFLGLVNSYNNYDLQFIFCENEEDSYQAFLKMKLTENKTHLIIVDKNYIGLGINKAVIEKKIKMYEDVNILFLDDENNELTLFNINYFYQLHKNHDLKGIELLFDFLNPTI